jgi:hypothetical protein
MKMEITEFRGVKFGESSSEVRIWRTDSEGVSWGDKKEEKKIGIVRVSDILYGFYKGKFMRGIVKFGGRETYEILLGALTEKYGERSTGAGDDIKVWTVKNVIINLYFHPEAQVNEGKLVYDFVSLSSELEEELEKKNREEKRMKINAAKSDL